MMVYGDELVRQRIKSLVDAGGHGKKELQVMQWRHLKAIAKWVGAGVLLGTFCTAAILSSAFQHWLHLY